MKSALLASTMLILGLFSNHAPPNSVAIFSTGDWLLKVNSNSFTGQKNCSIGNRRGHNPNVVVIRGAVSFRTDPRIDTEGAWYKISGGQPKAWRDTYAKLIESGSLADAERLDNPSGGKILIPLDELQGSQFVIIEPSPRATLRKYELGPLWTILASARGLGCIF